MIEMEEAELTERQRYWLEQIKACEASGMSASAYAAANLRAPTPDRLPSPTAVSPWH